MESCPKHFANMCFGPLLPSCSGSEMTIPLPIVLKGYLCAKTASKPTPFLLQIVP